MEVAARLEVHDLQERRSAERWSANMVAGLKRPALPAEPVQITDISTDGCRFSSKWPLPVGSKVRILMPGLEPWWASVSWFEDGQGGLQFDRPLHRAVARQYRDETPPS